MKILVVFTGGTIGSSCENGYISPKGENNSLLLHLYKARKKRNVEFCTMTLFSLLSENLNGTFLKCLAEQVKAAVSQDYDGIIVTHGSDTLQYSAAALSYALGLSCMPVLLVCSNYILTDERANGLENFGAAVDFIAEGRGRGVFVSYANEPGRVWIHRGTRLLGHEAYAHAVYSVSGSWYSVYENGRYRKNENYREESDRLNPLSPLDLREESPVCFWPVYPGMTYPRLAEGIRAVLLQGYHSGTLPTGIQAFQEFAKRAQMQGIPVFLCGSSVQRTHENKNRTQNESDKGAKISEKKISYESTALFDALNITILPCAAPIAMYMKLWFLAGEESLRKKMAESLGGDIVLG